MLLNMTNEVVSNSSEVANCSCRQCGAVCNVLFSYETYNILECQQFSFNC